MSGDQEMFWEKKKIFKQKLNCFIMGKLNLSPPLLHVFLSGLQTGPAEAGFPGHGDAPG
jgi:hypothetical protein